MWSRSIRGYGQRNLVSLVIVIFNQHIISGKYSPMELQIAITWHPWKTSDQDTRASLKKMSEVVESKSSTEALSSGSNLMYAKFIVISSEVLFSVGLDSLHRRGKDRVDCWGPIVHNARNVRKHPGVWHLVLLRPMVDRWTEVREEALALQIPFGESTRLYNFFSAWQSSSSEGSTGKSHALSFKRSLLFQEVWTIPVEIYTTLPNGTLLNIRHDA